MPLVFTVANPESSPATLYLMGRKPTVDFQVTDEGGNKVWNLLRKQVTMAPLLLFPLEEGKPLSFRQVWKQRSNAGKPVPLGRYFARAVLLTDDPAGLASDPVEVLISGE